MEWDIGFNNFFKVLVFSDPNSTSEATIPKEEPQTQSICDQIIFGNQMQMFPQKAIRKNFNLKREAQLEKP